MIKTIGGRVKLKLEDHGNQMNSGSKVIQTYINYGKFLKYLLGSCGTYL
jgi:hypothetical protein